jgi:hypothetical protein
LASTCQSRAAGCRVSRGMVGRFERSSIIEPIDEELENRVMAEIIRSTDCGNSPKNKFVENLEVAFAQRDTDFLLDSVADDVHWNIVFCRAQVSVLRREDICTLRLCPVAC